jgi:hypothetical protein
MSWRVNIDATLRADRQAPSAVATAWHSCTGHGHRLVNVPVRAA